jgi:hypothetical protein
MQLHLTVYFCIAVSNRAQMVRLFSGPCAKRELHAPGLPFFLSLIEVVVPKVYSKRKTLLIPQGIPSCPLPPSLDVWCPAHHVLLGPQHNLISPILGSISHLYLLPWNAPRLLPRPTNAPLHPRRHSCIPWLRCPDLLVSASSSHRQRSPSAIPYRQQAHCSRTRSLRPSARCVVAGRSPPCCLFLWPAGFHLCLILRPGSPPHRKPKALDTPGATSARRPRRWVQVLPTKRAGATIGRRGRSPRWCWHWWRRGY